MIHIIRSGDIDFDIRLLTWSFLFKVRNVREQREIWFILNIFNFCLILYRVFLNLSILLFLLQSLFWFCNNLFTLILWSWRISEFTKVVLLNMIIEVTLRREWPLTFLISAVVRSFTSVNPKVCLEVSFFKESLATTLKRADKVTLAIVSLNVYIKLLDFLVRLVASFDWANKLFDILVCYNVAIELSLRLKWLRAAFLWTFERSVVFHMNFLMHEKLINIWKSLSAFLEEAGVHVDRNLVL